MSAVPTLAELREVAFRSLWTFISAAAGGLVGTAIFDITVLEAAGVAGLSAAMNVVVAYTRLKGGTIPTPQQ